MSSVALKNGVEEPCTIERVAKFMGLLGYREITLKSDTEPGTIAFRNRVAEMCKAEVTTEDAVKGDKESNRAHRGRSDADYVELSEQSSVTCREAAHTNHSAIE